MVQLHFELPSALATTLQKHANNGQGIDKIVQVALLEHFARNPSSAEIDPLPDPDRAPTLFAKKTITKKADAGHDAVVETASQLYFSQARATAGTLPSMLHRLTGIRADAVKNAQQQALKNRARVGRRRQFERAQVDLATSYWIFKEDCIRKGDARIIDLSAGGARVSSATEFAQGSQVTLRFSLPTGEREVYVYGRIVMSFFDGPTQQYSHGVAFTHISHAIQNAIVRHVDDVLRTNMRFLRPAK